VKKTAHCGCEGSCPACRIGEVENHKCDSCVIEFCPKCHGIVNDIKSENVMPCKCKKQIIKEEKMEKHSYENPKGVMDGYVRIRLDDLCGHGKCFVGYGGCSSRLPIFDECEIWKIPEILKTIKKVTKKNPMARFFLDTPNFFDSEKRLNETEFQFQELLTILVQQKMGAYFSIQATPRELIRFLKDKKNKISPRFIRKAGIKEIWMGVESANSGLRRKYGKPYFENDELEEVMIKLQKAGIKCCFYLVASSDDTDETIQETVDFVRKTKPAQICPFDVFHYINGEHFVDFETVRANLDKVARFQQVLQALAGEVNPKQNTGGGMV